METKLTAESERSFITLGPSVHVSGTKMSYMLLLVLFSILSFGFLFFHVHHLCMPLLGPELVNKILVSCIRILGGGGGGGGNWHSG